MTKARLIMVAVATTLSVVAVPIVSGNIDFPAVANSSEPRTAPAPPTGVRAASGSTRSRTGTLTVAYAANASKDGVTKYTATCTSSNGGATEHGSRNGPSAGSITVAAVTTTKRYRCSVTATNSAGASKPSTASGAVIVGAPGRLAAPSVSRIGSGHLKVSFAKPADNGAAITEFKAVCRSSNGGVSRGKTGAASPLGVLHLTPGKTYACTVQATNSRGAGPESAPSNTVNARIVLSAARFCACTTVIAGFKSGAWLTQHQPTTFLGRSGDIPVPGDYGGSGNAEPAVFRPSVGGWYVAGKAPVFLGTRGDIPVPADYNGDGKTDIAVYRPSDGGWYIDINGIAQPPVLSGLAGDIPVPGDYNGDGKTDIAVYRPSDGGWYVDINGIAQPPVFFGLRGDIPVPADYNGDDKTDIAVYRSGTWLIQNQPTAFFGLHGDTPVPGDYNGDGTTDLGVYRPSTGGWHIEINGVSQPPVFLEARIDSPVPGDYRP